MADKKKQTMRFNDAELSLMKNTFSENEELLKAIRKVFLQMPLDAIDISIIVGTFKGKKELMALMSKTFKPELDPNAPLHQLVDLWMSLDLKDKALSEMMPIFQARKLLIDLLDQQLKALADISEEKEQFSVIDIASLVEIKGKDIGELYSNLMARNTLITHIDSQLTQLSILAGQKEETVEQIKERLMKDLNK